MPYLARDACAHEEEARGDRRDGVDSQEDEIDVGDAADAAIEEKMEEMAAPEDSGAQRHKMAKDKVEMG
jgi:hypothetical protein